MPLYYFHVRTGDSIERDDEGLDLAELQAAVVSAEVGARDLLAAYMAAGEILPAHSVFEITDASGALLAEVKFSDAILKSLDGAAFELLVQANDIRSRDAEK
jgi:hypothetical protein